MHLALLFLFPTASALPTPFVRGKLNVGDKPPFSSFSVCQTDGRTEVETSGFCKAPPENAPLAFSRRIKKSKRRRIRL